MDTLPLRAALKRGLLIVTANWPVVLVDFTAGSLYRLALSIPILGGSLMVAALVGADLNAVLAEGLRASADLVLGSLATAPIGLTTFLLALAVVAVGGEAVVFIIKTGTMGTLVHADRTSGDVHRLPIGSEALARARAFRLDRVLADARRFGRRAVQLALWLGAGYAIVGLAYLAITVPGLMTTGVSWMPAWPILVLFTTSMGLIAVSAVNLAYDLLRVIVVTDDCEVGAAVTRLRRFVVDDARQVIGIFCVMAGIRALAAIASLLAAAGLTIVAYVPLVSVVFAPLQAAAWVLRGLFFESLALSALSAYQTQYRRFSDTRWPANAGVARLEAPPQPAISLEP